MLRYHNCVYLIVLLACVAACNDPQMTDKPGSQSPAAQNSESTDDAPTESTVLKQEMIAAMAEIMKAREPNANPTELRNQIQETIDDVIVDIRKYYPEFLIVSAETEEKLRAGTPIQDSAKRIADAESSLGGFQTGGLVKSLLPQHKAGTLTPVRTELLAQFIVADVKKLEYSLTH